MPLDTYVGLDEKNESRTGCMFLVFDTVDNAEVTWNNLKTNHADDVLAKFAHYKLFFKITNLEDDCDYNNIKDKMIKMINEKSDTNVLYYKLYRKNNKYLGCGDLTLDTKDGMDMLLNKDGLKEFQINDTNHMGTFYRFDNRRRRTNFNRNQVLVEA